MPEPRLIPLADFRRGTRTNPAWQRASQGAGLDMVNVGVEGQGRPVPRLGYVVDETLEVDGLGDQLVRIHDLGNANRPSLTRTYRLFSNDTYENKSSRLFVASSDATYWINLQNKNKYNWGLEGPTLAPTVDDPELPETRASGNQNQILVNVFSACYTFESIAFGFESAPSPAKSFNWGTYRGGFQDKDLFAKVYIPNQSIPEWADRINVYMQATPSKTVYIDSVLLSQDIVDIDAKVFDPIQLVKDNPEIEYLKMGAIRLIPAGTSFEFATNPITIINLDMKFNEADLSNTPPSDGGLNWGIPTIVGSGAIEFPVYLSNEPYAPPPDKFSPIMLYAERMWGWDNEEQFLRFSELGNYDNFPKDFALELSASGQSKVEALIPAPSVSAFFVFKQDAIHVIRGSGIVDGLRMKSIADTDLDASGVMLQHGTLSPRTIISGDNGIYFISRDKKLKYLTIDGFGNTNVKDIGIAIDDYLAELTLEEQKNLIAFLYNNCYHIIMPGYVLVLDIQKRYWTRLTWDLKDAFWSEGGAQGESILYGIRSHDSSGRFTNDIVRLYEGFDDGGSLIPCEWESQDLQLPYETNVTGLIVQHTSDPQELSFDLYMDDILVGTFTGTPQKGNHFRISAFGYGHRARIRLKSDDGIPLINLLAIEIP